MKIWDKIEEWFVLSTLAVMGIVLTVQVFMRYIFNYPLVWSEELARYLFVWLAFIGAGYGVRHHIHIEMEAFYNKFPPTMKKIVTVTTNALAIFCFAYIIPYGIKFTIEQHSIASSAMGIPMSYVVAAVPIGCIIVVLRLLIETIGVFIPKKGGNI
ncbi:TRAP transporter small permease [Petroclostridium sp. X23]|uniref:TRAP transporter small permease n=1 Tax=Petroclostridium sp. X23 TaxID=3045146 RepID=UPI0024ADC651|nr:TRAP transporter small permease [Petroclostridium sp. X23]WHH59073.1 TRAP transporter small permease [Petroclostridium sp. X23]